MATKGWKEANEEKMRQYRRDWYQRNKEHAKGKVLERKATIKRWFKDMKSSLKCNRCSEDNPACLEFHHSNPDEKEHIITQMVSCGWSVEKIKEEMEKCEVLCANCHRKEHFTKFF
jgi:hypothetical protein